MSKLVHELGDEDDDDGGQVMGRGKGRVEWIREVVVRGCFL